MQNPPYHSATLLDFYVVNAPEPSEDTIKTEMEHDRQLNPHNDSYKPPRRSRFEIIADKKWAYARVLLQKRESHIKGINI